MAYILVERARQNCVLPALLHPAAILLLLLLQSNTAQNSVTNQNGILNGALTSQTALPIQIATIYNKDGGGWLQGEDEIWLPCLC